MALLTYQGTRPWAKAIKAAVDAGAPEGDAKGKPSPIEWLDGWNIKPDVQLKMPKAYSVPKTGTVEYTYFVIPSLFTKGYTGGFQSALG
jgi:hypothetical protein